MTHTPAVDRTPEPGRPLPPSRWPDAVDGPGILLCAACGEAIGPGEALAVVDRRGVRPTAALHRPSLSATCLRWAGRADRTSISLYDDAAARRHDRDLCDPHYKDQNLRRIADAMRSYRKSAEARPVWEQA